MTAEVGLTEEALKLYFKTCKDDERSRLQDVSAAVEDLVGDSAADYNAGPALNQVLMDVNLIEWLDQLDETD